MEKISVPAWPSPQFTQVGKTLDAFLASAATMPQAYLFLANSQGKELAEVFASKIIGNKFPNVDTVSFDAAEGNMESIREVLRLASLMPVSAERKVVFMENMDQASTQVLNALLKTLEEPPKHSVLIMLSSRPLLPTIMSRCQVFVLPKGNSQAEISADLAQAMELLEKNRKAGMAERMALVGTLANLDEDLLPQLIEQWMYQQVQELKISPGKHAAVRNTMETLQALRGNFNKKMVLQNFVTTGLY